MATSAPDTESASPNADESKIESCVMVIEDLEPMRLLIVEILKSNGHNCVEQATTGEEGLECFEANPDRYDAIFVDWELPGIDGLGVVKKIRSRGYQLPLIMVTGEARAERVKEAVWAGVTNYIVKPFDKDTFATKATELRRQIELRKLGESQRVRHAMTTEVLVAKPHSTVREAAQVLLDNKISGLPVVGPEFQLAGIITEGELVNILQKPQVLNEPVRDFMAEDIAVVNEDTLLTDAALTMIQRHVRRLPVVRDDRLVGLIARRDLIRFALENEHDLLRFAGLLEMEMQGGVALADSE